MAALGRRPSAEPARRATLLLIEDDDELRELMLAALELRGYAVDSHGDASAAIVQLKEDTLPDLILLDLNMPGMNGWEFRVLQKQEPRWARIPVIVMSGDSSPQAAAVDSQVYLRKPVDLDVLCQTIERLLLAIEQERREARTRELERLSSLGRMAAGVAHEVNNPLVFVLGNLELAEEKCRELERKLTGAEAASLVGIRDLLASANRGADRIATVVRGISHFATADTDVVANVDVSQVLESTLQLMANEMRHVCRVERDFAAFTLTSHPGRLGQVFLNLILHAVHAMRDMAGRDHVLRISAHSDSPQDIVISISDTGPGLSPQALRCISVPAYAIEPVDVGLCLGLSISRELVQSLGGSLEAESHPSRGATFRIKLPSHMRHVEPKNSGVRPGSMAAEPTSVPRRRLMVIDDEPLICKLLESSLAATYDVVALTQPAIALTRVLGGEKFDLILCDMMMPGVSGMDLYERAVANLPALADRFLFMTGGAFSESAMTFLAAAQRPQIRKPFQRQQLLEAIEAQLPPKH